MKKVKVRVPATIGNLGPGFDVLGMALDLYTDIEMSIDRFQGVNKTALTVAEKSAAVPTDKKNMIWLAAYEVFKKLGAFPQSCMIKSDNRIPLTRGLGSSAAARVGGLLAANALCRNKLDKQWILNTAARLEGHPDNVAPALIGGVVNSTFHKEEVVYSKIGDGKGLKVVLCIPDFKVSTDKARKVFAGTIDRWKAVKNLSAFTLCISAYFNRNYDILDEGTKDFLHQPYRKKLVPGMDDVFKAAMKAGAYGAVLSGSGSTIAALCPSDNLTRCKKVGLAMVKVFKQAGKKSEYKVAEVSKAGARVID